MPTFTAFDRCDHPGCTAQAFVRYTLPPPPTDTLDPDLFPSLQFCGHHASRHSAELVAQGFIESANDLHLLVPDTRSAAS